MPSPLNLLGKVATYQQLGGSYVWFIVNEVVQDPITEELLLVGRSKTMCAVREIWSGGSCKGIYEKNGDVIWEPEA